VILDYYSVIIPYSLNNIRSPMSNVTVVLMHI
jgi:hypothetical protein